MSTVFRTSKLQYVYFSLLTILEFNVNLILNVIWLYASETIERNEKEKKLWIL